MDDRRNEDPKTPLLAAGEKTPRESEGNNLPVAVDSPEFARGTEDEAEASNGSRRGIRENLLRILPIKNTVLFPHNVLPLASGKEWSLESLQGILRNGGSVGVVAQREGREGEASSNDLYAVGTSANVMKIIRFPDGSFGAILQGNKRFHVERYVKGKGNAIMAEVRYFEEETKETTIELSAIERGLKQLVHKAISLSPNIPSEAAIFIENVQDAAYLADLVIPYLTVDVAIKQELLEYEDIEQRLRRVHFFLTREIEILEVSQKIHSEVRTEVGKQQRRYYVKEQLKLLQKELGQIDGKTGSTGNDPADLQGRVEKSAMPQEAKDVAFKEIDRMGMMQSGSPEYMVSHTYVNWLLDVPWGVTTQKAIDLKAAKSTLDDDHFGLEKVKKRILEFLAVYALKQDLKGPILCLVGPPGVGKTSLGKSVAKSLGRKFVRIALGGVRDEAEIRGHRRTYIGSMPGKFVDALKRAGSMDPVILLDEVDKIATDFRGDPSSALLEVLDSEQNHTFTDHYLNVPVDLSKCLFIATANTLQTISGPLRDRMEVIDLSGYTLDEKTNIAEKYLWPQVLTDNGIEGKMDLSLPRPILRNLIQSYTREAGVRELKRQLATVARSVARDLVEEGAPGAAESQTKGKGKKSLRKRTLNQAKVTEALGPIAYNETKKPKNLPVGVATGLAYTPVGGDVLFIESVAVDGGSGKLSLTGQLGDVMKESVQTALAYTQANAKILGLNADEIRKKDLHVHFPAGAVKKDGPSAGVAILLSLVGLYSNKVLPSDFAVTGEISLRGDVLPVGGIKEKLIAAHRYGIKTVLIPAENEKDLFDLPKDVLKEMRVHPIARMEDAVRYVFAKANLAKAKRRQ